MQANTMFTGDVVFADFEYDINCLSNICNQWDKTPRFTLDFKQTFGDRTHVMFYEMTILTEEQVNIGEVSHFEVTLTNGANSFMLGYFEPGREHEPYYLQTSFNNNRHCKGIRIGHNELNIIRHLDFWPNDPIGLFFDLRDPENGCMYLTHRGKLAGLLHDKIQTNVRPGITICSQHFNYSSAKKHIIVSRSNIPPIGFDNPVLRQRGGQELAAEYKKGLGGRERPVVVYDSVKYHRTPIEKINHLICKTLGLYS